MSKQFQTYYQITFEDPVKLPCDITIYGKSMRTSSDCVLDVTAELDNENYGWQPVGTVTVKAPVISVEMPDSTSSGTVLAYLSIPSGQTVDIYDGDTLVLSRVRSGDVEIPLSGTAAGRVSVHTITFKWSNNNDISSAPVSQTVIHADGVPKLYWNSTCSAVLPDRTPGAMSSETIYTPTRVPIRRNFVSPAPSKIRKTSQEAWYSQSRGWTER